MTRAELNSIIEQVVGQITAANFDFLTGKPEYLNVEAGNSRLAFPLAFMTYPTATLNPYGNQVVGPLTTRYTIQIDFLQLVPVDDQNDAETMRTVTETMGAASREFLARMSQLPKNIPRIDINSVRDVVVNPHPASDNVLVGVSITFDALTADTFDYCELTPGGDIVLPPLGPQYVYFAGRIELDPDTQVWALLPGSLNVTSVQLISDVIGDNNLTKLKINIPATSAISFNSAFDSNYYFSQASLFFLQPIVDFVDGVPYLSFAKFSNPFSDPFIPTDNVGVNAEEIHIGPDAATPLKIGINFQGIALK